MRGGRADSGVGVAVGRLITGNAAELVDGLQSAGAALVQSGGVPAVAAWV